MNAANAPTEPFGASSWRVVAIVAALGIGLLSTNNMPLLLGAIMDGLGIGEARAGTVGSVELGAIALMSLWLAPRIGRASLRGLAIRGGIVAALGYGLSAFAGSWEQLLATRALVGLGGGAALAAGNAAVAASHNPDSLYAKAAILGGLAAAIQIALLPYVLEPFGYGGGYLALGVVIVMCLPLVSRLPAMRQAASDRNGARDHQWLAIPLLAAIGLEATAEAALWAFSERLGLAAGLDLAGVGLALAATTVAGLCGATGAILLGTRSGRALPIALGLAVATSAKVGVVFAETAAMFVAAQVLWGLAYFFTLPFVMGAAASLDSQGRWTAAAAGVSTIGAGLAPGLAGIVVGNLGYPTLGLLVLGLGSMSLLLAAPVTRVLDRSMRLVQVGGETSLRNDSPRT